MKITVPDSWNDVTIGQFIEIQGLDSKSKDYSLQLLSILLDQDPEVIRKFDAQSIDKIFRHIEWAMKSPDETKYNDVIEVEGVEYKLIKNLNSFSGGQWWDMEEYLLDYDNNIHNIIAMLYNDGKDYDNVQCKKRAELFKEKVSIGEVYGALVFFSIVEKESMISIQDSLIRQMRSKMKHQKNGNGGWKKKRKKGKSY